jgi:hypothetical protein
VKEKIFLSESKTNERKKQPQEKKEMLLHKTIYMLNFGINRTRAGNLHRFLMLKYQKTNKVIKDHVLSVFDPVHVSMAHKRKPD